MTRQLLEGLNPEQREAVSYSGSRLLVLAGAGSGKTRVITRRVAWLVLELGVPEQAVLAVTFTIRAAREMRERLESLLGPRATGLFVGTFHAWGLRLLRRYGRAIELEPDFAVLDRSDQLALMRELTRELKLDEGRFSPRRLVGVVSRARNQPRGEDRWLPGPLQRVLEAYEQRLRRLRALDFDDLLLRPLQLFERDPGLCSRLGVGHMLVDEYQDTNRVQGALVERLAPALEGLVVVGDEDQSIYAFRGARVDNILEFERRFPGTKVLRLERNYRSTAAILETASALVAANRQRLGKRLVAEGPEGEPVRVWGFASAEEEASAVVGELRRQRESGVGTLAVLYRTNVQARLLEEALLREAIPYRIIKGQRFYERREVKDLLTWARVLVEPEDDLALQRVINVPARGIGPATIAALKLQADQQQTSLWRCLLEPTLEGPARERLRGFRELVQELQKLVAELEPGAALERILRVSGYGQTLERAEDAAAGERREHVEELLQKAGGFSGRGLQGLAELLDAVALTSEADTLDGKDSVNLMTLHNAKGLEFDAVVIGGVEEGLLPHPGLDGEGPDVEEERRLLYVGITRARKRLLLSWARDRFVAGAASRGGGPSRFLGELPERWLERREADALRVERSAAVSSRGSAGPASPRTGYRKGSRVRHQRYGLGTVIDCSGSGDNQKLTVYFDGAGRKKLVARFAGLEPAARGR